MGKTYAQGRRRHPPRPRKWTREVLIERAQAWAAAHNGELYYEDWRSHPDWEKGTWPSTAPPQQVFGTWGAFLEAAGLEAPPSRTTPRSPSSPKVCPGCGEEFERRPNEQRGAFMARRFCSMRCSGRHALAETVGVIDEAVRLRVEEDLSNQEIAERLGFADRQRVAQVLSNRRRKGTVIPCDPYFDR